MWTGENFEEAARRRVAWLIGIVAVLIVAAGGWYWYRSLHAPPPPPPAARQPPPTPAPSIEPQIAHPLPGPPGGAAALPALNDSDQVARDSLAGVLGKPLEQFLVPQSIVRHIVVTVDNLPRRKVAVDLRPLKPTAGQTVVTTQGEVTTLSDANFARYASLMRMVQGADAKSLAVVYQRLYPLFQQAYEDLGYPGKYFNDRLVEVIDHLLQTPEAQTAAPLVQPKVFYEYADPDLESRSAGQKLLMRMGPANERIIKDKLRAFRAEIVKNKQ